MRYIILYYIRLSYYVILCYIILVRGSAGGRHDEDVRPGRLGGRRHGLLPLAVLRYLFGLALVNSSYESFGRNPEKVAPQEVRTREDLGGRGLSERRGLGEPLV